MRMVCLPLNMLADYTMGGINHYKVALFQGSDNPTIGSAGRTLVNQLQEVGISPTPPAWDLLSFALAVVSADNTFPRKWSPDGWTRQIELHVGVSDKQRWDSLKTNAEQMLAFLTGDQWTLNFIGGIQSPQITPNLQSRTEESVCLLSGGLDSLIGLIDLAQSNASVLRP